MTTKKIAFFDLCGERYFITGTCDDERTNEKALEFLNENLAAGIGCKEGKVFKKFNPDFMIDGSELHRIETLLPKENRFIALKELLRKKGIL